MKRGLFMKSKVFSALVLLVLFVFSTTSVAFAVGNEFNVEQLPEFGLFNQRLNDVSDTAKADQVIQKITLNQNGTPIQIDEDNYNIRFIDGEVSTFGMGYAPSGVGSIVETLESGDIYDVLLFSVPDDRLLRTIFTANSADYRMNIGKLNTDTMMLTLLTDGFEPNIFLDVNISPLPSNECYALYMSSVGQYGQSYQVNYNFTTPTSWGAPEDDNWKYMTFIRPDSVYVNGERKLSFTDNNPVLKYDDRYYVTWSLDGYGGYRKCSVSVDETTIDRSKEIIGPKSYSAPGVYCKSAYSEAAILIPVGYNSLIMSSHTYYQSGPDHIMETDWRDFTGLLTPRRLSSLDKDTRNYLVYDLATGTVIDWYSNYNSIYTIGYKDPPVFGYPS